MSGGRGGRGGHGASSGGALLPREHGAYAQFLFPQLTALALGGPTAAQALLIVATLAAFLAHEPALVVSGGRGGRARRELGAQAWRRLAALAAVGLPAAALGLWLAPSAARAGALVPFGLATLLVPFILTRREKTAAGELIVALALSTAMIPTALAASVPARVVWVAATVWAVAFSLSTFTVRAIIARAKRGVEPGWRGWVAPLVSAAAVCAGLVLAITDDSSARAAVAVVPTALVALVFGSLGIHPRQLRRLGWSLVASNVVALLALLLVLRPPAG